MPDSLRSLWHYHAEMWHFNITLHSPHPYQSNPWSWIVLGPPDRLLLRGLQGRRSAAATSPECSQAITAARQPGRSGGAATIAIAVLLVRWALGRDWRAGAILAGLAAGYLPWFQ